MKKTLLLTSMLLALTASVALAGGGVNFAWGTICYTEALPGAEATVFACNVNTSTGNRTMTASFISDVPMMDMVGIELVIEGKSDAPALPDWWKLGAAPDCRAGRATFNTNYTGSESEVCVDWTAGAGFNAPNYLWADDMAHVTLGAAIDAGFPYEIIPGQEYYAGGMTELNSKTVGTGACTGCATGMIWGLKSVRMAGLSGGSNLMTEPIANQCIIWNNSVQPCQAPVPARNTTWGQVKSLYR